MTGDRHLLRVSCIAGNGVSNPRARRVQFGWQLGNGRVERLPAAGAGSRADVVLGQVERRLTVPGDGRIGKDIAAAGRKLRLAT